MDAAPEPPAKPGNAGAATKWRGFLRALVDELDAMADPPTRDQLLRGIGARMAQMHPMPASATLDALQLEMNDALAETGWGSVAMELDEDRHCLVFTHHALPRVNWAGDPPGTWLAPVLLGLYETWMSQQAGADGSLSTQLERTDATGLVVVRYGA